MLFLTCLVFPVRQLSHTRRVSLPESISFEQLEPGSALLINKNEVESWGLQINFESLSQVEGLASYFYGIDLNQNVNLAITGSRSNGEKGLEFFSEEINVAQSQDNSAYELQINPNRWKTSVIAAPEIWTRIQAALSQRALGRERLLPACINNPTNSKQTSAFGSLRKLPNGETYRHTGVDLRAQRETEVFSPAGGLVVLTESDPVYGDFLVIDHGADLFSVLAHLSHFKVSVGDPVTQGQLVALSGDSGRIEAPHLHWELLWRGHFLNPIATAQILEPLCGSK